MNLTLYQAVVSQKPFRRRAWKLDECPKGFNWVCIHEETGELIYEEGNEFGPLTPGDTLANDYEVCFELPK